MNRESILGFENKYLMQEFVAYATRQLGELKINDILQKVNTSGKVSKFLKEAEKLGCQLGTDDFLGCIHSSLNFTFANAETISVAGISLLLKWNLQIGIPYGLSDDHYLNKRFFSILEKCNGNKVHLKSTPNFFDRFLTQLEQTAIEQTKPVTKTEIFFDDVMYNAIKKNVKTEFRLNDHLAGINVDPDVWILESYDEQKGANLINSLSGKKLTVYFPYKLGSMILVTNISRRESQSFLVKTTSVRLERIKDVDEVAAQNEGFGAYEEYQEMWQQDPSFDGALYLFEKNWITQNGRQSLTKNEWLWTYGIGQVKSDDEIDPEVIAF